MSKTYEVLNQSDISGLDYGQLTQDSESTVRLSKDGLKAIVAYEGSRPSALSGITALTENGRVVHTRAEMLGVLTPTEWLE